MTLGGVIAVGQAVTDVASTGAGYAYPYENLAGFLVVL